MNYPLAKIIEILACGTLGFFEYNRFNPNIINLKLLLYFLLEFQHYK